MQEAERSDQRSERLRRVIKSVSSTYFWLQLTHLEEVITPIYEDQLEAQTDRSHISYVRGR